MIKNIKKIEVGLILLIFFLFIMKQGNIAPDNAIVYIDTNDNRYFPEIYFAPAFSENYIKSTFKEVKEQGLEVKEGMYDFYADRNMLFTILKIPVYSHPIEGGFHSKERWDKDGSWNW